MPIPKEILAVERPVNSVVFAYGKNKDRYSVRKRVGCRYDKGRRLPVTGPTIGHIVEGRFIPLDDDPGLYDSPPEIKDWANAELCDRVSRDLLDELLLEYPWADAVNLYCIAALRVCCRGVRNRDLKDMYEESFLSEAHPGATLSKNTVSKFLKAVGKGASRIISFMRRRAAALGIGHHVLIDGTLKTDDSKVNSLSDFSRKSGAGHTRDVSVLYAFDLEKGEPVCSQCYPGSMPDITAYEDFLSTNGITRGLIVADSGFPSRAAEAHFAAFPDLRFLNPVKRNSREIKKFRMDEFDNVLSDRNGVSWKKADAGGGRWLYSFRDAARAAKEECDWLARARRNGTYSDKEFRKLRLVSGLIVLESNADLAPEIVYKTYGYRWEIEIVMNYYKNACALDDTRVHSDYSVIGSEFCDFLASVMTFRLIHAFDKARLMEKHNYGRLMDLLRRAKKVKLPEKGWRLVRTTKALHEILEKLALLPAPAAEPPKRRRGRPRKRPAQTV